MKVLIVTGSSGGHIFPALSFQEALRNRKASSLLVLPRPYTENQALRTKEILGAQAQVKYLSISNLKLGLGLKSFISMFRFLKGSLESISLLVSFRPDIVAGFGSINSVWLIIFSWLFRIKTLIHEQNLIPGRANRFLAIFADKVAVSFKGTEDYLKISPKRIVFTGNPLRPGLNRVDKDKALSFFGLHPDKFTILVMGGSLGSQRINSSFLGAVSLFTEKESFQAIHISGALDFPMLDKAYKELGDSIKLFSFLNQMQYAYSACDLALCRAGATTIAEFIKFEVPAILIPYPFARRHQLSNAGVLETLGSCLVIKDNQLEPQMLKESLEELMHNPDKIRFMRSGYRSLAGANASELLANAALALN